MSYRIDPRSPLSAEIRRIGADELGSALDWLSKAEASPDKALHETRKRMKSVRALLSLVRSGDKGFVRAENDRYRQVAALLAGPRQAGALIETVDRLAGDASGTRSGEALAELRESLVAHRDAVLSVDMDEALVHAGMMCREGIDRFGQLKLSDAPQDAADILAAGAARALRQARNALRMAGSRQEEEDFHDLRKAAKAHLMHLSLLRDFWPSPVKKRRKAVLELTERLGELQDIFVLRHLLAESTVLLGRPAHRRRLDQICKQAGRRLMKICIAQAEDIFQESSKRPERKLASRVRRDMACQSTPKA